MIDNRSELGRDYFGMSVVEIVRDKMVSIAGGVESTVLCD
jgi:hypothetical protein